MSPTPDPPKPEPIAAALWAKIIGAAIATILFGAFLILGGLAAVRDDVVFNCSAFAFLAPAFAVGAAMAAMFLGGGAAVAGNLGEKLQGQALAVSLSGGVAVLVIMFGIFFGLKPEGCNAQPAEAYLEFRGVPDELLPHPSPRLWTRRNSHDETSVKEVSVLVSKGVAQQHLSLMHGQSVHCSVSLTFAPDFDRPAPNVVYDEFDLPEGDSFKLDYMGRRGSDEFVPTDTCFQHRNSLVEIEIAVATDDRRLRIGRRQVQSEEPDAAEFAAGPGPAATPEEEASLLFGLVAPAAAAELGMPYADLRRLLIDGNDDVRVEARRLLTTDFDFYAEEVRAELFAPDTKMRPDLQAALLSALIGGIEAANPSLAPAGGRNLDQPLPYLDEARDMEQVLLLTSHPDADVRQQARRLMQRYPVDGFVPLIEDALARAERTDCASSRAGPTIYATIFFTYNRLIQQGLDAQADPADWEDRIDRIQDLAERCIDGVEKVDAALLDYGRALAYAWSKHEDASRAAVADFQSYIEGRTQDYYMQGHLQRMADLW